MRVIRAICESYDHVTHTAALRPEGNPTALLAEALVAADCPGELVRPGRRYAVLTWDDVGALVLCPFDAAPLWPPQGHAQTVAYHTLTAAAGAMTQFKPDLSVALTVTVPSYFWVHVVSNYSQAQVRRPHHYVAAHINGAVLYPVSVGDLENTGRTHAHSMAYRSDLSYAPGAYTFQLGYIFYQAGHAAIVSNSTISVFATPA
jgi:hypothetical protein